MILGRLGKGYFKKLGCQNFWPKFLARLLQHLKALLSIDLPIRQDSKQVKQYSKKQQNLLIFVKYLLFHENCFITDFKEKAELLNSFFSNQCSLLKKLCKLSINLRYVTDKKLHTINFTANNIEKIILSLNPSKANGHDNNLCMLR